MKRFFTVLITCLSIVFMAYSFAGAGAEGESLSGKVAETMNSGGYTYMLLEKGGKKTWVAVPQTKVTKGQNISVQPGFEMVNFESKTLNKKFDKIIFSGGIIGGTKDSKAGAEANPHGSKTATPPVAKKIKVEKASGPNAYTIAEIYKNKKNLDNKPVVVRAEVVKVSKDIMQKNWIHLQDGTGSAKDGSHDIVLTTKEIPAVGDILTVSGTLFKDKDFGSGYKYDVIIENASIKK